LEKANKLTNTSRSFFFCLSYGCVKHHSPVMNKTISGTRLILSLCPEHCVFTSPRVEGWITKILPVGPTGRYTVHKIHNWALLKVKEFT